MMKNIKFITCEFCDKPFIVGAGHLCWCADCSKKHFMCNDCYIEGIENNTISATPKNKMKYNTKTIEEGI